MRLVLLQAACTECATVYHRVVWCVVCGRLIVGADVSITFGDYYDIPSSGTNSTARGAAGRYTLITFTAYDLLCGY
jgi:hypothetical protein